jgi:serine/threonine protein kinase
MLTTKSSTDSVIKLVDFGCAQVGPEEDGKSSSMAGKTLAYCPPEQLSKGAKMHPSMDLWALGVILYISEYILRSSAVCLLTVLRLKMCLISFSDSAYGCTSL